MKLVAVPDRTRGGRCCAPSPWRSVRRPSGTRRTPEPHLDARAQENMPFISVHTQPHGTVNKPLQPEAQLQTTVNKKTSCSCAKLTLNSR